MTDQEKIEAFIASRGVTRVPEGANTLGDMTPREWAKAARSTTRISAESRETDRLIRERHTVVDHLGNVRVRNGLGEWIA